MASLIQQLKQRRIQLGLKQHDMRLRVGMSRQQYQRLESKGNPRLDTLELLAKGLKSELMLIPQNKLDAVRAILAESENPGSSLEENAQQYTTGNALADNPWQGLLEDDE